MGSVCDRGVIVGVVYVRFTCSRYNCVNMLVV